jgi:N-carbamoyl-L-amino-acid hydrolase
MEPAERAYARELFERLFAQLSAIGLDAAGATTRLAWTQETAAAERWFEDTARALGLEPERDRNGNLWAWLGERGPGALVTGSHLDSVREGGRFDGALGVVAGFVAVHLAARRLGVVTEDGGPLAAVPLGVVAFADEEGGRFDTPTFGSRALCGALDVEAALARRDRAGVSLSDALAAAGVDPQGIGPDPERLAQVGALVELHIEQDTLLEREGCALALGTGIMPHGRWRVDLQGEAAHAGTTPLELRRDPMLALAAAIVAARSAGAAHGALATVGKLEVSPNATNAVAGRVSFWLDIRAHDEQTVSATLDQVLEATRAQASRDSVGFEQRRESFTAAVEFSPALRARIEAVLSAQGIRTLPISTGAGHDAGTLAATIPTAMLFVRSSGGAGHSPQEHASVDDCLTGIAALVELLTSLETEQSGALADV